MTGGKGGNVDANGCYATVSGPTSKRRGRQDGQELPFAADASKRTYSARFADHGVSGRYGCSDRLSTLESKVGLRRCLPILDCPRLSLTGQCVHEGGAVAEIKLIGLTPSQNLKLEERGA